MQNTQEIIENVVSVLLLLSGGIAAYIPTAYEIKVDKRIDWQAIENTIGKKEYTKAGKSFIVLSFLAIVLGVTKVYLDYIDQCDAKRNEQMLNQKITSLTNEQTKARDDLRYHDLQCKQDADIAEWRSKVEFARLRDSLHSALSSVHNAEINLTNVSDKNTQRILDNDTVSRNIPAYISAAVNETTCNMEQKGDTVFFYPKIRNGGTLPASPLSFEIYYIITINGRTYEYGEPLSISSGNILEGQATLTVNGNANYIPFFNFDSTNVNQFILIQGKYNESERFSFSLIWNARMHGWGKSLNNNPIAAFHASNNKSYFFPFNGKLIFTD